MSRQRRVLVVDDERDLADLLVYNLRKAGFDAAAVYDGRAAVRDATSNPPDLIILDLMLPELSGLEVASRVRGHPASATVPILMLTAKAEEVDQVVGLSVGADDYITKPFSLRVLLARIEAILRRTGESAGRAELRCGPITLHTELHRVHADGQPVTLTLTEFRLLAALMQAGGRVLGRDKLIARALGPGITVTERTIDVHITAIRRKLGPHGDLIRTVRGVGYSMSAGEESSV